MKVEPNFHDDGCNTYTTYMSDFHEKLCMIYLYTWFLFYDENACVMIKFMNDLND